MGLQRKTCRSLILRCARPGDAEALTALAFASKASNGYDADFMEQCRAELTYTAQTIAAGQTWLIEAADGQLLGFFDLRLSTEATDEATGGKFGATGTAPGTAEVFAMFVRPGSKGLGIGARLWEQLEQSARLLGAGWIGLDSDPNACGFYQRMGMKVVGEAPSGSIAGRMLPRLLKRVE